MGEKYNALMARLEDIRNLDRAGAVLDWDMNTKMPPGGAEARASQLETISRIHHEMFIDEETSQLLEDAAEEIGDASYDSREASMIRVVRYDLEQAVKLPTPFVAKFSRVTSEAHHKWVEAREKDEFSIFLPHLEQIIEMCQERANYLGYDENPYDALLQEYERSMTTAQVQALFDGHKQELIELVAAISEVQDRVDDAPVKQVFPVDGQRKFGLMVAEAIGYDFNRGRLDESVHPFSISFSKNDSRITTRYEENWLNPALFGIMHECGHSMYEQGIGDDIAETMIGKGTSLGVHESQSRTWENLVGRSRGFWQWAYPRIVDAFPDQLKGVDEDTFYKAINKVYPSYIRVEADECTYNLHIMLRFEIEQMMINGKVKAADIPQMWNDLFKSYLGLTPPNNRLGCLQDIHWSFGGIGYFSTYALGNLLSVQYYNKAVQDVPSIPDDITNGKFDTLRKWQNENIHRHGRKYDSDELTRRVTGEGIQSRDYIAYLKKKFSDIYDL